MADIDTGTLRAATAIDGTVPRVDLLALCDEVDRLRAAIAEVTVIVSDLRHPLDCAWVAERDRCDCGVDDLHRILAALEADR